MDDGILKKEKKTKIRSVLTNISSIYILFFLLHFKNTFFHGCLLFFVFVGMTDTFDDGLVFMHE
jgi:hypothetical protein